MSVNYGSHVVTVIRSGIFDRWLRALRDPQARARINARGAGVSELRIDYGPGYRVYYTERRGVVIVLLAGGDKSSQPQDIKTAIALAKGL